MKKTNLNKSPRRVLTKEDIMFYVILIPFFGLFFLFNILPVIASMGLSLFDYVIGISIGNFTAEMTMDLERHYINGMIAIIVFGVIAYLVSIITMKSMILRRIIIGVPTILIQNGKIIEKNLKNVKLDINELLEQCRGNGYFDLSEIEYAIMETNGKVSILPKSEYKSLTPKDMNLKLKKEGLCANIIIDGHLMTNNIENMNKTIDWVQKELKVKGYKDINKILLATLDIEDKLIIYEKNKNVKVYNVLE